MNTNCTLFGIYMYFRQAALCLFSINMMFPLIVFNYLMQSLKWKSTP